MQSVDPRTTQNRTKGIIYSGTVILIAMAQSLFGVIIIKKTGHGGNDGPSANNGIDVKQATAIQLVFSKCNVTQQVQFFWGDSLHYQSRTTRLDSDAI